MTFNFDPSGGLIIVAAEITGPTAVGVLRLALDTGATSSLINSALLVALGYDVALAERRVEMTTGSGIEFAAQVELMQIRALGIECELLPVLAHTLPPSAGVDGLLGLDYFSDRKLTIDFRRGQLSVT